MVNDPTALGREPSRGVLIALYVIYVAIFVLVYVVLRLAKQDVLIPSGAESPLVLAPFVTASISALVLSRFIFPEGDAKLRVLSILCLAWTTLVCVSLSVIHHWQWHLIAMIALFFGFAVWDRQVLSSGVDLEKKVDVWEGHVFINVPTICSVVVIGTFLLVVDMCGSWSGSLPKVGFNSLLEAFTTGLVAFHLGVAACSYVLVSTDYYESVTGLRRPEASVSTSTQQAAGEDAEKSREER